MQEDYDFHKEAMKSGFAKGDKKVDMIYLLKETYPNRHAEMKLYARRPMYELCTAFPVFTKSKYVSI